MKKKRSLCWMMMAASARLLVVVVVPLPSPASSWLTTRSSSSRMMMMTTRRRVDLPTTVLGRRECYPTAGVIYKRHHPVRSFFSSSSSTTSHHHHSGDRGKDDPTTSLRNETNAKLSLFSKELEVPHAFMTKMASEKTWQRLGPLVALALASPLLHDNSMEFKSVSIADVGCDHGLLAMGLALTNHHHFESVLGLDVSQAALTNGALALLQEQETIFENHQTTPLEFRLSNGLQAVLPGEADIVCIAGMGPHTMVQILLDRCTTTSSSDDDDDSVFETDRVGTQHLILQPTNSRPRNLMHLYDSLQDYGWSPVQEHMEYLSSRWYLTTSFVRNLNWKKNSSSSDNSTMLLPGQLLLQQLQQDQESSLSNTTTTTTTVLDHYIQHHVTWIRQDFERSSKLSSHDARWLRVFENELNKTQTQQ